MGCLFSAKVTSSPLKPAKIVVDLTHLRKVKHPEPKEPEKKIIETLDTINSEVFYCPKTTPRGSVPEKTQKTSDEEKNTRADRRIPTEPSNRKDSLKKRNLEISISKIKPQHHKSKSQSFAFEAVEHKPIKQIVGFSRNL